MKKKLFLVTVFCLCALMITGCSDKGDGTPSVSKTESTASETKQESLPFSDSVGVWTYSDDIIFHSSDGNRYLLKQDNAGTVQDKDGQSYSIEKCEYKLIAIVNISENTMNIKEGRFSEAYVGSQDYPDGYKTMMIAYQKSDLFDIDALEKAVKGETPAETVPATETETAETATEAVTTEPETETSAPETTEAEAETTVTETETSADTQPETSGETENPETAEYAAIYKKVEDFLATDNYQQKDPGNRSLEIFNYLHNLADSNIEQNSITNNTDKNEVSFKCYDKYVIIINNTDGTIAVKTE